MQRKSIGIIPSVHKKNRTLIATLYTKEAVTSCKTSISHWENDGNYYTFFINVPDEISKFIQDSVSTGISELGYLYTKGACELLPIVTIDGYNIIGLYRIDNMGY